MSRLLVGSIRKELRPLPTKRTSIFSGVSKYDAIFRAGLSSSQHRLFSQYLLPKRVHAPTKAFTMGKGICGVCVKNYTSIGFSGTIAYNAQVAWKRLARTSGLDGAKTRITISRIAQAVSLGLSRSHIIVPGILTLMCGSEMALAQAVPEADVLPLRNNFYASAENSHLYLTRLIISTFEGLILLLRALYLTILFTPSIVMAPFADSFGPEFRKLWLQVVHHTLERAGPAFIKWGQWAATRPDLFPRDLCVELSKLHTKAPEHSFAYTKKVIEKAFGRRISDIFNDFEEEPVASGSIAQVHRASLRSRYRGRQVKRMEVAVKVRHPGVGESIKRDFDIINTVARMSRFIPALNWLRLDESVQQFAVFMMSQVDLAREAAHLSRFIYNFRRWKDVSFPKPVYPLVHPAVLVESFEHGESVAHYFDELEGNDKTRSALAHIGTHALLKMLLVDNFVHADMHPGNILVRVAQRKPSRRDGQTAAECTLKLSKKQNCPKPEVFIQEVKESFDFWGTEEGDLIHPAECMQQLLEKVRRHKVNVDGNVCTVMVTVLVLEGWQRKLDPDYDVMHTLQTLLLKSDWATSLSYTIESLMAP